MASSVPLEWRDGLAPLNAKARAPSPPDRDTTESPDRAGTPRLRPSSTIASTPEPPLAGAFKKCPDFAKINTECHNALRSDTFSTPTSLNSRYHTPSRLEKRKNQDDPVEFQRRMIKAVLEMQSVQKEQQESMETLRKEMTDSLQEHAIAREALERICQTIAYLEERSQQPLDLSSVHEEMHLAKQSAVERQDKMEVLIVEQMKQVMEEIQTVRQQQEQAEKGHLVQIHEEVVNVRHVADVKDVVCRSETQLADLLTLAQSLTEESARTSQEVQDIQREHKQQHTRIAADIQSLKREAKQHHNNFEPCLQEQLALYHRNNAVHVDFDAILGLQERTRNSVKTGFDQVLGEIARVQQALHVDFARVIDDMGDTLRKSISSHMEERTSMAESRKSLIKASGAVELPSVVTRTRTQSVIKPRKRFRHYWAQTDEHPTQETWVQTDDEMWKNIYMKGSKKSQKAKLKSQHKVQPESFKQLVKQKTQDMKKVFQDAESMKNQVRRAGLQPQYNVADYYYDTGVFQCIAKNWIFENLTLFMILMNVIWIGVDTDHNPHDILVDADPVFQVVENAFCLFFSFELLVRFLAFRQKKNCLRDYWFIFDSLLVTVMIAETWVLSIVILSIGHRPSGDFGGLSVLRIFRFARVVRVSRLARLMRAIPEIVVLLKGVGIALRSVLVFFMLWLVVIFVFAIIFRQLTDGDTIGKRYFPTVPASMNTLLLHGLLPENESIVNEVTDSNPIHWILMMAFILGASLTLMHMLVGVLVETISIISVAEREGMAVNSVSSQLRFLLVTLDFDPHKALNKAEFQQFIMEPGVARMFRSEGVDTNVMIDMAELIFQDLEATGSGGLSFEMLVEIVLNMRGNNPATVKDVEKQVRMMKSIIRDSLSVMYTGLFNDLEHMKNEITEAVQLSSLGEHYSEVSSEGSQMSLLPVPDSSIKPLPGSQTADLLAPPDGYVVGVQPSETSDAATLME